MLDDDTSRLSSNSDFLTFDVIIHINMKAVIDRSEDNLLNSGNQLIS